MLGQAYEVKIKIANTREKLQSKISSSRSVIKRIKLCGAGDKNGLVDHNINFILKNMCF